MINLRRPIIKDQRAFTITEIVVLLPVIVFLTGGLVVLVMSMYYQMVANITEMNMRLEAQALLLAIEDELLFATDYGEVISNDLADVHEPTGGWTYDTNPDTLIVYETSLTAPRRDPNREFVYKNQYGCASVYNDIAIDNVIYYTEPNEAGSFDFKRRILTPQYATCGTNYRGQTCPEASVGSGPCVRADNTLSEKLSDFQVDYYDEDGNVLDVGGGGADSPLDAEAIRLNLTLEDTVFGRDVEVTARFTMRKIN